MMRMTSWPALINDDDTGVAVVAVEIVTQPLCVVVSV